MASFLYNFFVNNTILEKAWLEAESEFKTDSDFSIFGLAILTRYTIESEILRDEISDANYSALHSWLHPKSVSTSKEAILNVLFEIIDQFNNFRSEKILKKISNALPESFITINDLKTTVKKRFNLYIDSISLLSAKKQIYLCSGVRVDKPLKPKISFITIGRQIKLNHPYNVVLVKKKINDRTDKYFLESFVDAEDKFISEFEEYFSIRFSSEVSELRESLGINLSVNPIGYDSKERILLKALHCAYTKNKIHFGNSLRDYLPFYKDQLNANLPIQQIPKRELRKYYELYRDQKWFNNDFLDEFENKNAAWEGNSDTSPLIQRFTAGHNYGVTLGLDSKYYIKSHLSTLLLFKKMFVDHKSEFTIEMNVFGKLNTKKSIVLVGPAGHGKTYTINKFHQSLRDKNWLLIAPSWKAISIYKDSMPHITSQKVSQLLKKDCIKLTSILKEVDFVIIDEMSMIDDWNFLSYIATKTKVIFVGDNKQIPPVNQVQSSIWLERIAKEQDAIWDLSRGMNFRLMFDKNGKEKIGVKKDEAEKIRHLLNSLRSGRFDINNQSDYIDLIHIYSGNDDLYKKIEMLIKQGYRFIVQKNIGPVGTNLLNLIFSETTGSANFKIGDQIIFNETSVHLFHNQQEGIILDVTEFSSPGTDFQIMSYKILLDNKKEITLTEAIDDEPFSKSLFITAHRSQGSTIEKVAVIVDVPTSMNWLYSAASRVSDDLIILVNSSINKSDIK